MFAEWHKIPVIDLYVFIDAIKQLCEERDQLKKQFEISKGNTEAALNSFHAESKQRRSAEDERDQLKKVLDGFSSYHVFETKTI